MDLQERAILFETVWAGIEAAKGWIDKTYPKGSIKYFGEV